MPGSAPYGMATVDYLIVGCFLTLLALAGFMLSRLIKDSDDFFVAGRQLTPFILAATITATNVHMFSFIGQAGVAYQKGISIIWQTWTGNMALVLSGIFVIPILRRLRVRTVPEFLEMRYSRCLRVLIGAFWGLKLCFWLGLVVYVASTAAVVITGYNNYGAWLLIFSVIAIIYSAVGGAWAVAIMDSFQFIITLIGALIVFPVAMRLAGYIPGLVHWLGAHGKASHMQFVPSGASEFNWLFVLGMVLLSIKWACVDQAILQRAFGAKDPKTVAKGMVFAGLITTPFAFLWILPGIATNVLPAHLLAQIDNPDKAMPVLLASQLPLVFRGLLGIVLCGLVASQMSVITSDINSVATLFTSDVFRHMTKKELTQRQLLMLVRVSAIVTGVLMLLVAWFMQYSGDGAVRANLTVVGIVDMPLFVITVIFGLLWRRTTWQGALVGFFAGGIVGCMAYFLISHQYFCNLYHWLGGDPSKLALFVPADMLMQLKIDVSHWHTGALAGFAAWLGKWHQSLGGYDEMVKSIAPFVSSGAALIVTPIISLLTKPTPKEKLAVIRNAFVVTKEETDDSVGFHLVPTSTAGKVGVVLMLAGYAGFLGGVLSANWQFPMAAAVAIASMVVFFIGGVTRVHAD